MTIMLRNNRLGLLTALKYRVPDRFESFQWKEIFLWTEEHRKKFRQARLGYKMSEEARAKLSLARKGRKLSQETIDKIAEAQKKSVLCLETGEIWDSIQSVAMALGVTTPWIGEVCNTHKGTVSGLHFCFVSDIAENTLENRQKMIADIDSNCKRIQKRPVRCIETGIVYESVTAAGKSAGVNRKRIEKVCKTKGTAAGYHWEYI